MVGVFTHRTLPTDNYTVPGPGSRYNTRKTSEQDTEHKEHTSWPPLLAYRPTVARLHRTLYSYGGDPYYTHHAECSPRRAPRSLFLRMPVVSSENLGVDTHICKLRDTPAARFHRCYSLNIHDSYGCCHVDHWALIYKLSISQPSCIVNAY